MFIFNYHWNLCTKFDLFMILHEWDEGPSHVEGAWDPLRVTPLPHCCAPAFSPLSLLSSLSNLTWLLESRQRSRILKTLTLWLPLMISELNEWSQFLERRAKFFHDCRERKLHNISSGAFTSSCCTVQIGKTGQISHEGWTRWPGRLLSESSLAVNSKKKKKSLLSFCFGFQSE